MNKNVILTIAIGDVSQIPYANFTIPSFLNYSKKVNADFFAIDENYFGLEPTYNKFKIYEWFCNSPYEKMLYVDLDIKILDNSPNIFNMFNEAALVIDRENRIFESYDSSMTDLNFPLLTAIKEWTKVTFNEEYNSTLAFNAGVVGLSKNSAKKLLDTYNSHTNGDLVSYIQKYKPRKDYDQSYLNYFLSKTDINTTVLDCRFNATARWKDSNLIPEMMRKWENGNLPVKPETHHFIHYKNEKHLIGTDWDIFK
jgi:hypothetical protein